MRFRAVGVATALVGSLSMATAISPGLLLVTVAPSEAAASYGLEREHDRLQAIQERLTRHRARRGFLEDRIEDLDAEVAALDKRREEAAAALRGGRLEAALLEQRLDQLMPRVTARSAAVREHRERVGRLLADLASSSRRVELDQTVRARLLAISPVMLRRLRGAEARLAALEEQPEAVLARQAEIKRRAPTLAAELEQLQRQREQKARELQETRARLDDLLAETARLAEEQRVLGQRLLTSEAAQSLRAGQRADQPALPAGTGVAVDEVALAGAIRGDWPAGPRAGLAVHARQPVAPVLIGATPEAPELPHLVATVQLPLPAVPPAPAKPVDVSLKGDLAGVATPLGASLGASALDIVFLEPAPLAGVGSRVAPARLTRARPPLVPAPDQVVNPFSDQVGSGAGSDVTIMAAPGQSVAAPEAGRVVFAGTFRSYGKLLIIEHQREYHTLLWGFSELDVAKGDRVRSGQIVGVMADDAEHSPELHVELRHNGRPVNPLPWLAASSNKVRG